MSLACCCIDRAMRNGGALYACDAPRGIYLQPTQVFAHPYELFLSLKWQSSAGYYELHAQMPHYSLYLLP